MTLERQGDNALPLRRTDAGGAIGREALDAGGRGEIEDRGGANAAVGADEARTDPMEPSTWCVRHD
jgi:hypothetical protein